MRADGLADFRGPFAVAYVRPGSKNASGVAIRIEVGPGHQRPGRIVIQGYNPDAGDPFGGQGPVEQGGDVSADDAFGRPPLGPGDQLAAGDRRLAEGEGKGEAQGEPAGESPLPEKPADEPGQRPEEDGAVGRHLVPAQHKPIFGADGETSVSRKIHLKNADIGSAEVQGQERPPLAARGAVDISRKHPQGGQLAVQAPAHLAAEGLHHDPQPGRRYGKRPAHPGSFVHPPCRRHHAAYYMRGRPAAPAVGRGNFVRGLIFISM